MTSDLVQTEADVAGSIDFELSYTAFMLSVRRLGLQRTTGFPVLRSPQLLTDLLTRAAGLLLRA
jgi:hypothetical protein